MAGAWKTSGSINNQHGVRRRSLARYDTQSEGSETNAQLAEARDGDSGSDGDRVRPAGCGQKSGGILKMYDPDSPPTMSILEEATIGSQAPMMGVFNNLAMYDQHVPQNSLSSIVPDLATGWSWNEDGTALTLPLRKAVKWHDGKPFTAADVKCTWDLLMETGSDKLRFNPRKSQYKNLDHVSTNGDYEVTFHLKRPQPGFLNVLAGGDRKSTRLNSSHVSI